MNGTTTGSIPNSTQSEGGARLPYNTPELIELGPIGSLIQGQGKGAIDAGGTPCSLMS